MKKKWTILIALVAIAVMVFGVLSSGAWFTDTKTTKSNTFTAGTLVLGGPGIKSFTVGDITNMAPGDKTGYATIGIKNKGTTPLAWFGNWEFSGTDNKLYDALYVDFAKMEFLAPDGTTPWESMDNFIEDGVGAGTYKAGIDSSMLASPLNKFGVISLHAFDNNASMTPGFSFEHMGALKTNYSYKLTVRFGFAEGAGNDYQGSVAGPLNVKFTVNAVQITEGALDALNLGLSTHKTWLDEQIAKQLN